MGGLGCVLYVVQRTHPGLNGGSHSALLRRDGETPGPFLCNREVGDQPLVISDRDWTGVGQCNGRGDRGPGPLPRRGLIRMEGARVF